MTRLQTQPLIPTGHVYHSAVILRLSKKETKKMIKLLKQDRQDIKYQNAVLLFVVFLCFVIVSFLFFFVKPLCLSFVCLTFYLISALRKCMYHVTETFCVSLFSCFSWFHSFDKFDLCVIDFYWWEANWMTERIMQIQMRSYIMFSSVDFISFIHDSTVSSSGDSTTMSA